MKITIIFPARDVEMGKSMVPVMPLAPTLLAALTPDEHEVSLVDMFYGDKVDYDSDCDLVAITVRTPLAVTAYSIADQFMGKGKSVILGGPHIYAFPNEAKQHVTAIAIGEADELWPQILTDFQAGSLKDYYVCGPYNIKSLNGSVYHQKNRPSLKNIPMMRRDLNPYPVILTLAPMPGSQIYDEYQKEGRIINDLPWNHYGGESIVFKHPKMDANQMYEANTRVLHEGFSMGRILSRTLHTFRNRPSPGVGMSSFFTQLGMRKSFRAQFKQEGDQM